MKIISLHKNPTNLIEKAKKGERRAQQKLFQQLAPVMLGICRRYINSIDLAEGVMLSGFLKMFENIDSFKNEGSFEGWVKRIMINESLSFLRKEKKFETVEETEIENKQDHAIEMETSFEVDEIQNAIDELPEGYRVVFVLYVIEGYKHREIAKLLEISENTSKTQLFKARKMLQEKLEKINSEYYGRKQI